MQKTVSDTLDRVAFLARRFRSGDIRYVGAILLMDLGIPTNRDGYTYLKTAIVLYYKDPSQMITKGLYPAVAKLSKRWVTGAHVERSIRAAIDTAWVRRDEEIWRLYFPYHMNGDPVKPTNTEFLSQLAQILELWEGCREAYDRQSEEAGDAE